ncbi:MAG: LamG domain-containing protein [Planctomycetes bacterium]|nr:LamG domain-containing protein [Planctomycetota bacterium]
MKKIMLAICFMLVICSVSFAEDPNGGLLAWWKMDGPHEDEDPNIVWDYSGNEYHGGTNWVSRDKWKNDARWFYGAPEGLGNWGYSGVIFETSIAESLFSNIEDEMTIMFWATSDGNDVDNKYFFTAGTDIWYEMRFSENKSITAKFSSGHFWTKFMDASYWVWWLGDPTHELYCHIHDSWTHFAIVISSVKDYVKISVNGQPFPVYSGGDVSNFASLIGDVNNFMIGGDIWSSYKGYMKDFRIYDHALSLDELYSILGVPLDRSLTINIEPNHLNSELVIPSVGEHQYYSAWPIYLFADGAFINCPDIYEFDHWIGDVEDPNSPTTKITLTEDKEITAVYIVKERVCGDLCHPVLRGDLNGDCYINVEDFALYCEKWLSCTAPECD